jgi:hypothetical protein
MEVTILFNIQLANRTNLGIVAMLVTHDFDDADWALSGNCSLMCLAEWEVHIADPIYRLNPCHYCHLIHELIWQWEGLLETEAPCPP